MVCLVANTSWLGAVITWLYRIEAKGLDIESL